MLRVEHLDVFHGDAQALDDVSIEIAEGTIVAIVGANGAGKTSLIRTIAGMLSSGARADRVPRYRYRRLGKPPGLQPRDRSGRGRPAAVSDPRSRKTSTWVRWCRAPAQDARNYLERVLALFPVLGERARQAGGHPLRRRAADAGDRALPDGRAGTCHV